MGFTFNFKETQTKKCFNYSQTHLLSLFIDIFQPWWFEIIYYNICIIINLIITQDITITWWSKNCRLVKLTGFDKMNLTPLNSINLMNFFKNIEIIVIRCHHQFFIIIIIVNNYYYYYFWYLLIQPFNHNSINIIPSH